MKTYKEVIDIKPLWCLLGILLITKNRNPTCVDVFDMVRLPNQSYKCEFLLRLEGLRSSSLTSDPGD